MSLTLRPLRVIKSASFRNRLFSRSMLAFVGVSALLFLVSSVLNVNTMHTGPLDKSVIARSHIAGDARENKATDLLSIPEPSILKDHNDNDVNQLSESPDSLEDNSFGVQRHNRVLHFMDNQRYGDAIDGMDKRRSSGKNELPQQPTSAKSKLGDYKSKFTASFYLEEEIDNNLRKISSSAVHKSILQEVPNFDRSRDRMALSGSRREPARSQEHEARTRVFKITDKNRSAVYRNSSEVPVKRLPKAIIIGVKKSGTRALLEFLRMHPNVEGPGPEPHFFDWNYEKGLDWYRELMPRTYKDQMTIEKTPGYFITPDVPKRIRHMNSSIKLILVVRDPVTRAISDYCQAASKRPLKPFEEMAMLDPRTGVVNTSWRTLTIGQYAKHMERWLQTFPLHQIHFVDGQKLITEPAKVLAGVEEFLGLPKFITQRHFYMNSLKGSFPCINRNGHPHCLDEKTKGRQHPKVDEEVLTRLRGFYRPFNAKFYQMVGRDFGWS